MADNATRAGERPATTAILVGVFFFTLSLAMNY